MSFKPKTIRRSPLEKELSDWQLKQWVEISSMRSWSVQCRLCGWATGTDSRENALSLFREHFNKEHKKDR